MIYQSTSTSLDKISSLSSDIGSLPPAQLWVGNHEHILEKTKQWLQNIYCLHEGCTTCTSCRAIADEQHHSTMWLHPENNYSLEDIAPILSTLSFGLDQNELYFFIITKADFLTTACSNSLLKSLEEPPPGYHFILLAQRPEALLSTIRSRCVLHSFYSPNEPSHHRLYTLFSARQSIPPLQFLKELDQLKIQDQESFELIDQLLFFWIGESKKALASQEYAAYAKAQQMIDLFKKSLLMPPMPGSSTLFWKNLFLQIKELK